MFVRIRNLREDSDKTQREVSDYLFCDQSLYSKYERGLRDVPVSIIIKLALIISWGLPMRKLNIQTKSEPPAIYDRWLFSAHIGFSYLTEDMLHYFLEGRYLALADLVYGSVGVLAGFRNGLFYLSLYFFFTYAVMSCNTFEYIVVFHSDPPFLIYYNNTLLIIKKQ